MFSLFEWSAVAWFLLLWVGYSYLSNKQISGQMNLSKILNEFRHDWMKRMLMREQRISDMSAVANLERNAGFFASTCMFLIAGVLTVIAASDKAFDILNAFAFIEQSSELASYAKLIMLLLIYVYCFFTFTWCMRQYGFCSVLIGSAPLPKEDISDSIKNEFAKHAGSVLDQAGKQFNLGLRGVYFSLAVLTWFVGTEWFMLVSAIVVMVLYRREFKSKTLKELVLARGVKQKSG